MLPARRMQHIRHTPSNPHAIVSNPLLLPAVRANAAGLMALGHWHGVATGDAHEQSDLDIARQLMATCYEMYRRTPAGLSPEIVFFDNHEGGDFPKKHAGDVGGGDFHIKPQVLAVPRSVNAFRASAELLS